jgi:hypothetical protein
MLSEKCCFLLISEGAARALCSAALPGQQKKPGDSLRAGKSRWLIVRLIACGRTQKGRRAHDPAAFC